MPSRTGGLRPCTHRQPLPLTCGGVRQLLLPYGIRTEYAVHAFPGHMSRQSAAVLEGRRGAAYATLKEGPLRPKRAGCLSHKLLKIISMG